MKVKNTKGGTKNNQEITASLNHKGPFINFIKTSYTVPWDYLRIKKKKSVLFRYIQMQNFHETILCYYTGAISR